MRDSGIQEFVSGVEDASSMNKIYIRMMSKITYRMKVELHELLKIAVYRFFGVLIQHIFLIRNVVS